LEVWNLDFKAAVKREVTGIVKKLGLKHDDAFAYWFATQILDIGEDEALEAVSVEGANDKGIDFFFVDRDRGRVLIGQAKYSTNLNHNPKEKDVSVLESSLNWLMSPEALQKEGRADLAEAANDYLEALKDDYGVELLYVYAGLRAINIEKKIAVYNQNPEHIAKNRAIRHYHLDLIRDLWEEVQGGRQRIQSDSLDILQGYETKTKFGEAFVGTIPCSELVRLHDKYGNKLFERNVRLYLGARKGSVNAGIADTLKDKVEHPNFWAYNNGIAFVCDSFQYKSNRIILKNFCIVNGCQTTVSLAENKGTSADLQVLVRLIAASDDIIDNVIRYTNSQNPIRPWDIASQDKTQRRLRADIDKMKKPYIYLTRRGARPTGDLSKYREGGKLRLIPFDLAGQYMAAFKGKPGLAYKDKALIFSRHHDEFFNPDLRGEEVLFVWLSGQKCRGVVLESIKNSEGDARILKRGGTLFSLAVLGAFLVQRNGATYLSKAEEERITSNKTKEAIVKAAKYSVLTYLDAVRDELQVGKVEVTTLLRQSDFFDRIIERARRRYQKDELNKAWFDGAFPRLWS
jgi:hypothetical protein